VPQPQLHSHARASSSAASVLGLHSCSCVARVPPRRRRSPLLAPRASTPARLCSRALPLPSVRASARKAASAPEPSRAFAHSRHARLRSLRPSRACARRSSSRAGARICAPTSQRLLTRRPTPAAAARSAHCSLGPPTSALAASAAPTRVPALAPARAPLASCSRSGRAVAWWRRERECGDEDGGAGGEKKRGTVDKEEQMRRRNGVLPRTYAQFQKTARVCL
jgi:hypothetical protein